MTMPTTLPVLTPPPVELCPSEASEEVAGVGVTMIVRTPPVTVVILVYISVGMGVGLGLDDEDEVVVDVA